MNAGKYLLLLVLAIQISSPAIAQNITLVGKLEEAGANYRIMESLTYKGDLYFSTFSDVKTMLWKIHGEAAPEIVFEWPKLGVGFTKSYALNKIYVFNDRLFFTGTDLLHGLELWTSDGTSAGTHIVKDIYAGPSPAFKDFGTRLVFAVLPYTPFQVLNGRLVFVAADSTYPYRLWETDGTEKGTLQLPLRGNDSFFVADNISTLDGKLWFSGAIDFRGTDFGLYSTDGTQAGTKEVKHFLSTDDMLSFGAKLFMVNTNSPYSNPSFGVSDGTENGTGIIDSSLTFSEDHVFYANNLFFFSRQKNGIFCRSDGTKAGTFRIRDSLDDRSVQYIARYTHNQKCHFPLAYKNQIYFCSGSGIWKSDGTYSGTLPIVNFPTDSGSFEPHTPFGLISDDSLLYFKLPDSGRTELFICDGTASGTHKCSMHGADYIDSNILIGGVWLSTELSDPIIIYNKQLYYTANYYKSVGKALYKMSLSPPIIIPQPKETGVLTIFPNPTGGDVNIKYPSVGYNSVSVYDAIGGKVMEKSISTKGQDRIDGTNLQSGIYFIRLDGPATPLVSPLIIRR